MAASTPRLMRRYQDEIAPKLMQELGRSNLLSLPRLYKIVINMGVGRAIQDQNPKLVQNAAGELAFITGLRPIITLARHSVSGFRLRKGNAVGCSVTLRGHRMYEFLDRLINIAIPRIRDFRGVNPKSFDGHGNYSMGVAEQVIFPEINADKVERIQGMDITMCMRSRGDEESLRLLKEFGLPFREN